MIDQIDEDGNIIERWELQNPFITSVDFGGSLDYASDDMNEVTVELTYDWAKLTKTQAYGSNQTLAAT